MENKTFKPNMSLTTNLLAALCVITGAILSNRIIFNTGLFALSGAITNWLAIHMLFEKVPGLYGSGVIPARFEDFKKGIHALVMGQFFNHDNMERFFEQSASENIDLSPVIEQIDFDPSFDTILTVIMESSFAPILDMMGGVDALMPLKEPFVVKIKEIFLEIAKDDSMQDSIQTIMKKTADIDEVISKIEIIVQKRLNELTPRMVKEIIQDMIRRHLGWLVVWGGIFGGFIGLLTAFIPSL
jgi:uncharacterized membrane protein YheB (UPF0754 family)